MKSLKYVFVVFVKCGISKVVFVKLRLFFFKSVLIGVWLLYNEVLVSTAFKMNRLCIYNIHTPSLWGFLPIQVPAAPDPRRVPCAIERVSLVVYSMHGGGYMSVPVSQCIPPPFPPWSPYICSLCLCVYFCFANKIIYTMFLDCTYVLLCDVFLSLTYFALYDSLQAHLHFCRWFSFIPFHG